MLQAPLIALALAGSAHDCDLRATVAGELMALHQSGADAAALTNAARATVMRDFAAALVARVTSAPTEADPAIRELAAFHFAAEIHAECRGSLMS